MKTTPPTTAFLGAGNMAGALLRGAILNEKSDPAQFGASDQRREAAEALASELGIRVFASNAEAVHWAQRVVLAVKPQVLPAVLREIAPALRADTLVISIAAGVSLEKLRAGLGGHACLVRAMPNTPALVGQGATALCESPEVSAAQLDAAMSLFRSAGWVGRVDEKQMDAVTGLSGSGPAYAFVAIEALSDAGVREGLPRAMATRLAAQTLLGAAKMVLDTEQHPAVLKDAVTSPGGTTIMGLGALERHGFRAALLAAVAAACRRSRELGQ